MRVYTVDQGNTNSSILSWNNWSYQQVEKIEHLDHPILISNVTRRVHTNEGLEIRKIPNLFNFIPFEVNYSSLGTDRLMVALAAFNESKENDNILIIDAGSFTTIDLLSEKIFRGGMIIPGDGSLMNIYKSGSNLFDKPFTKNNEYPFNSTEMSMRESVPFFTSCNIPKSYSDEKINKIFITGGNAYFHHELIKRVIKSEQFKRSIDITIDPILVHRGLRIFFEIYPNKNYQDSYSSIHKTIGGDV